jgi:NH3-dependent NAD+ synthetase
MAILRLLQNSQLAAEDMARLVVAYEETLRALCLIDRGDPITDLVARKVIEIGLSGVRDSAQISSLAVKALS